VQREGRGHSFSVMSLPTTMCWRSFNHMASPSLFPEAQLHTKHFHSAVSTSPTLNSSHIPTWSTTLISIQLPRSETRWFFWTSHSLRPTSSQLLSHVAQAGPKLANLLPQPPNC
jgi:hypothetical protein